MIKPPTAHEVRPFLATVATQTRPFNAALPAVATPAVTSPWLPRVEPAAPPAPPAGPPPPTEAEIAAIYEDARTRGRADGLAETSAMRDKLRALLDDLTAARAAVVAPAGDLITELTSSVIEAWTELAEPGQLLAPVIRRWVEQAPDQPATLRVHPQTIAALTEVVGDLPLTIAVDPSLAPGALAIQSAAVELHHDWRARLPELRTAIASVLTGDHAAADGEPADEAAPGGDA